MDRKLVSAEEHEIEYLAASMERPRKRCWRSPRRRAHGRVSKSRRHWISSSNTSSESRRSARPTVRSRGWLFRFDESAQSLHVGGKRLDVGVAEVGKERIGLRSGSVRPCAASHQLQ